jgi:hypothetical protein
MMLIQFRFGLEVNQLPLHLKSRHFPTFIYNYYKLVTAIQLSLGPIILQLDMFESKLIVIMLVSIFAGSKVYVRMLEECNTRGGSGEGYHHEGKVRSVITEFISYLALSSEVSLFQCLTCY